MFLVRFYDILNLHPEPAGNRRKRTVTKKANNVTDRQTD